MPLLFLLLTTSHNPRNIGSRLLHNTASSFLSYRTAHCTTTRTASSLFSSFLPRSHTHTTTLRPKVLTFKIWRHIKGLNVQPNLLPLIKVTNSARACESFQRLLRRRRGHLSSDLNQDAN
uniref:(northern house mosquito) hypothetical protein n=1 Tax=Culex pipiens TaxID=7175 RepID=A0A8D8L6M9_CULPI